MTPLMEQFVRMLERGWLVLITEAAKMDELEFVSGGDVQALVERLYTSPPGVLPRAQAIVATN